MVPPGHCRQRVSFLIPLYSAVVSKEAEADRVEQDSAGGVRRTRQPGAAYGLFLALGIIIAALMLAFPLWVGEQLALATGGGDWRAGRVVALGVYAAAVLLPAQFGRRRAAAPRYRAAFTTWMLAAVLLVCLLPAHLAAPAAAQTAAALQLLGLLLYLTLLAFLRRRASVAPGRAVESWGLAVFAGALLAIPWIAWGALGSPLDTALNLAAALLFGLAAGRTLAFALLPALRSDEAGPRARVLFYGLAVAVSLAIMAFGFGVNGQQLILLVLLPPLGWLVVWLARGREDGYLAPALLLALATAAPLLFIDPDELNLILNLGARDVGYYTAQAALIGATLATVLSGVAIVLARGHALRRVAVPLALASAIGLGALYGSAGEPGWHGERLFVILADQPDLSAVSAMADPGQRRAAVYDTLVRYANLTQADLRATLDRLGVDYTPYYLVNAVEVDGGPGLRLWLERRSDVDRVLVSPELRPLPQPPPTTTGFTDTPETPLWSQRLIGAPRVWDELGVTGRGIIIGQSDSGVDADHPELRAQYRGHQPEAQTTLPPGNDYNWFDPWYGTTAPTDRNGHGTHTLATALGASVGVAPEAMWIACVNLPRNLANPPRYLDCLQFLLAPYPQGGDPFADGRPDLGAQVLNNSWGCPEQEGCDPLALLPAARALRAAGVFVVASAGNEGPGCGSVDSPLALYDEVFTVGAIDEAEEVTPFSSRGPVTADGSNRVKPDVVAPGVGILSAYPGSTYYRNEGTSMAGPHVAGVVALLWSANPALIGDIDATERILIDTAQPASGVPRDSLPCDDLSTRPNDAAGYGIVDAYAAVQRALEP